MVRTCVVFVCVAFAVLLEASPELHGHRLRHHESSPHRKLTPKIWNVLTQEQQQQHHSRRRHHAHHSDEYRSGSAEGFDSLDSSDGDWQVANNELDAELVPERRQVELKCPKCEHQHSNVRITEEELTQLRIDYVKKQILNKLRLKDKPNVSAVGLPKPIYDGETIKHYEERSKAKDMDDYYARTSKKFIFLEQETSECSRIDDGPSICFTFKIDDIDVEGVDVNKAILWVYKKRSSQEALQQTIVVSELEKNITRKYLPKVKPVAIQSVDPEEGWVKIDVEWLLKHWYGNHVSTHFIHISCQSCEISSSEDLITTEEDYRPFIEIDSQSRRRHSRQKRSVNCTAGVSECCREKLYISFDDIGWGDWIIQPRGYNAYFCRGSCSTVASIAQLGEPRSQALRRLAYRNEAAGKKALELIPCCTPRRFSSLNILFSDSNSTATIKTFPNMVIDSCGCM